MRRNLSWTLGAMVAAMVMVLVIGRFWSGGQWIAGEGRMLHSEVIVRKIQRLGLSNVESFTNQYDLELTYEYFTDGERQLGHNLRRAGGNSFGVEATARQMQQQFPEGKTVQVFHDPKNPAHACLLKSFSLW